MEFKPIEVNDGAQIFFSGLEEVRFIDYNHWRRGVDEMLAELQPTLLAAEFFLHWETYYARRADEMEDSHLSSSEAHVLIDQIDELLQRLPTQYTSFSLHLGEGFSSGHQMWHFEWSGIETDANGRPLAPDHARIWDSYWHSDLPQPGGVIWRTSPHDAKAGKQKALDIWFGGKQENATAFFEGISDELSG